MVLKIKDSGIKDNRIVNAIINVENNVEVGKEINNDIIVDANIKTGIIPFLQTWIDNKLYRYIANSKLEKEKFMYEIKQKILKIPTENQIEPRISILGPVLDGVKYNLNEKHIKEMFVNILTNEMDNRKQNNVLPAYVEIIKQLSQEDANFLIQLKNTGRKHIPILFIRYQKENGIVIQEISKHIIVNYDYYIPITQIILENCERLNLVKIETGAKLPFFEKEWIDAFEKLKKNIEEKKDNNITYAVGVFDITDFGENFMNICCS